jgi:hypothetical protein
MRGMTLTSIQQQWATRVAEWRASGLSSTEFCAGRGYSAGALRHYAHFLERRRGVQRASASDAQPSVRLVRVEAQVDAPAAPAPVSPATLTVEIGAARVVVPAGFDAATVRAVLDALAATGGGRR